MASVIPILVSVAVLVTAINTSSQGDSCKACNCQFSNVEALDHLIESKIENTLRLRLGKLVFSPVVYCLSFCSFIAASWTPVNITEIGSDLLHVATTLAYSIPPDVVPDAAVEILLYSTVFCGSTSRGVSANIVFYVEDGDGILYRKFLYMVGWDQLAYNTNSDNMWFPMPSNRMVYVEVPVAFRDYCYARVSVIGYR